MSQFDRPQPPIFQTVEEERLYRKQRLGVVREWQRKYDKASPQEKKEFAAKLIEADEEGQRRRNSYLKSHWDITHRALGYEHEAKGIEVIYDAWRREVLAYLLDIPVSQLPKLVSVSEAN